MCCCYSLLHRALLLHSPLITQTLLFFLFPVLGPGGRGALLPLTSCWTWQRTRAWWIFSTACESCAPKGSIWCRLRWVPAALPARGAAFLSASLPRDLLSQQWLALCPDYAELSVAEHARVCTESIHWQLLGASKTGGQTLKFRSVHC